MTSGVVPTIIVSPERGRGPVPPSGDAVISNSISHYPAGTLFGSGCRLQNAQLSGWALEEGWCRSRCCGGERFDGEECTGCLGLGRCLCWVVYRVFKNSPGKQIRVRKQVHCISDVTSKLSYQRSFGFLNGEEGASNTSFWLIWKIFLKMRRKNCQFLNPIYIRKYSLKIPNNSISSFFL